MPFNKAVRNVLDGRVPASLKSSVFALLFRPGLRVGKTVSGFGSLIAMGLMGNNRGEVVVLKHYKPGTPNYLNNQQV